LNQKHSRWYQRRKQIEAELRREFNLPEEDLLRDAAHVAAELRSPLNFGRPPPAPKPRRNQSRLPPIPRLTSEPPRRRWGLMEDSEEDPRGRPRSPPEDRWWRQEQEELRRRSRQQTPEEVQLPAMPVGPAPAPPPPPVHLPSTHGRRERPYSWRRNSRVTESVDSAGDGPAAAAAESDDGHGDADNRSRASVRSSSLSPSSRPQHVEKAKELEEIAQQHRLWHEEQRRRAAEAAEREAAEAERRRADEQEKERRRRAADNKMQELKRAEERRLEELKREETERHRRESQEAERRRKEQEDWEREIRQKFKQEEEQRRQRYQQEMENESERNAKVKAQIFQEREQQRARRQEEEEDLRRERLEREARKKDAEAEVERLRQKAAAEAKADAAREAAEAEAERLRRRRQERHSPPGPKRGRPASFRSAGSAEAHFFPNFHGHRAGSSEAGHGAQRRAASVPVAPTTSSPADEALKQAEAAAMQQLKALQRLATKEEKQRAFKDLLRAWHPDKNPQSVEVATAVFQRLQAERKRVLS